MTQHSVQFDNLDAEAAVIPFLSGQKLREHSMNTAKADVHAMLDSLPDDTSLEDIQYHLYVLEKIRRGSERADAEGVLSHEQAKQRLGKWLTA